MNTSLVILRDKRKYEYSGKLKKKKVLTKFERGLPECNFGKAWSESKKVAIAKVVF